jgi:hypothetical protein
MNKWISVRDDPPKESGLYYIFPHKYDYVAYYENGEWTTTDENGYEYTIFVTYYLPIPPDPPEVKP